MKILFLADVHLGIPNRTNDLIWALRVVREYATRNDVTHVVVLGDLFHDRDSISIDVLCAAYEFFKSTKEQYKQEWIVFCGNHDMYLKHSWKVNSLKPFSDVLQIIDDVKLLKIGGSRFWVVPFVFSETNYMQIIRKIETKYEKGDVLLTHIGVKDATLNACFLIQHWTSVSFTNSKFDIVYTGHFHTYQQVGDNVWYVGSIIPFKFDEGDVDHGFIEYDTGSRTHGFRGIWDYGTKYFPDEPQPPRYCTVLDNDLDDRPNDDVVGHAIRIATTKEYTPTERENIKQSLLDKGAASVKFMDIRVKDRRYDMSEIQTSQINADQLFEAFVAADDDIDDLNKDLLRKLNLEVIAEGDEIYALKNLD